MRPSGNSRTIVALGSLAVLVCSACASQSSSTNNGNRTLIVEQSFNSGPLASLDPAHGILPTPIMIDKSVYDTLLTLNPSDLTKPYPALATSFTVSPDAKTFTFQLRPGVKFANGDPLTSADVVWSLTRLRAFQDAGLTSAVEMTGLTATAPDPSTVVLKSDSPNPAVPIVMTQSNTGILDSKLVQQNGGTSDAKDQADAYLNGPNQAGSGPYMITAFDRTNEADLQANPNYWGPKPTYNKVIVRNVPSATQQLDIQDGQAQMALNITLQEAQSLGSSVRVIAGTSLDQEILEMNADPNVSPLTANQHFRDAVRYGLDYQGILVLAGKGAASPTGGLIPVGILGALPASDAPQRDVALAKAALAQVGVSNPTVELDYSTDGSVDGLSPALLAAKIQSDLKQIGITVNLVANTVAVTFQTKIATGKAQIWFTSNQADYPDPSDFLIWAPGGFLGSILHWKTGFDPSLDTLVTSASSAVAIADRNSAYQALGKAMNVTAYLIDIVQPGKGMVVAKSVNAIVNPFNSVDLGSVS